MQADFDNLVDLVDQGEYESLLEVDQLRQEMQNKRAFLGFSEPPINFPPTFKVREVDGGSGCGRLNGGGVMRLW